MSMSQASVSSTARLPGTLRRDHGRFPE
jgi:hypothetical protein